MSAAPDDITAMRADGDLLDFVRSLAPKAAGKTLVVEVDQEPEVEISRSRPGAWPAGTSPPESCRPQPPAAWAAAIEQFRTGAPGPPCECDGCRPGGS